MTHELMTFPGDGTIAIFDNAAGRFCSIKDARLVGDQLDVALGGCIQRFAIAVPTSQTLNVKEWHDMLSFQLDVNAETLIIEPKTDFELIKEYEEKHFLRPEPVFDINAAPVKRPDAPPLAEADRLKVSEDAIAVLQVSENPSHNIYTLIEIIGVTGNVARVTYDTKKDKIVLNDGRDGAYRRGGWHKPRFYNGERLRFVVARPQVMSFGLGHADHDKVFSLTKGW